MGWRWANQEDDVRTSHEEGGCQVPPALPDSAYLRLDDAVRWQTSDVCVCGQANGAYRLDNDRTDIWALDAFCRFERWQEGDGTMDVSYGFA